MPPCLVLVVVSIRLSYSVMSLVILPIAMVWPCEEHVSHGINWLVGVGGRSYLISQCETTHLGVILKSLDADAAGAAGD